MGSSNGLTSRHIGLGVVGVVALAGLVWFFVWWWPRPPQMGADQEVARTVDALFTAITARDENLLADCGQRLHTLRDAGRLPAEASAHLDRIIGKARAGRWEAAAQALYDFMRAQRRERTREPVKKENNRPRPDPRRKASR